MITALVADAKRSPEPARSLAAAVVIGLIVAVIVFTLLWDMRSDVAAAIQRPNFLFKFVVTLSWAVPALLAIGFAMRPGRKAGAALLAIAPTVLAIGVLVELFLAPAESWSARMIGSNAAVCLMSVPLLAVAPFVCLFHAVRSGAPTRPRLAGALCGLAAAAIGATLYAAHCTDDSPLFVAVWYSIAIGIVTLIGSVIGARWLRW
jgi:hypothetical protein